jgi:hypothetical protein
MKNKIKAIETRYKGYRFRSRLEARWAVFFDALGIEWEYEFEGFVLPNGTSYLPDFYLPDLGIWVEVKPFDDFRKAEEFVSANAGDDDSIGACLWAAAGVPSVNHFKCILPEYGGQGKDFKVVGIKYLTFFLGLTEKYGWFSFCHKHYEGRIEWTSTDIEFAIHAARSARFEFGQEGAA